MDKFAPVSGFYLNSSNIKIYFDHLENPILSHLPIYAFSKIDPTREATLRIAAGLLLNPSVPFDPGGQVLNVCHAMELWIEIC